MARRSSEQEVSMVRTVVAFVVLAVAGFDPAAAALIRTKTGWYSGAIVAQDTSRITLAVEGKKTRTFRRSQVLRIIGDDEYLKAGDLPFSPNAARQAGARLESFTCCYYGGLTGVLVGLLVSPLGSARTSSAWDVGRALTLVGGVVLLASFTQIGAAGEFVRNATESARRTEAQSDQPAEPESVKGSNASNQEDRSRPPGREEH